MSEHLPVDGRGPLVVDLDQSWVEDWQVGERPPTFETEGIPWMRSRPQVIKDLMLRFPPSCLVRATRPLDCPRPGTIGRVVGLGENGDVTVIQGPDSNYRAWCQADWLEVVGYWKGLDPAEVARILAG